MSNDIFVDEEILNQPNEAFPDINRTSRKPKKSGFIKYFSIMYFFSAVSGFCGLIPLFISFQSYPPAISVVSLFLLIIQISVNGALGYGFWTLKPWAWWIVTTLNPLGLGFGYTVGFLLFKDFINSMNNFMGVEMGAEMIDFTSIYSNGMILTTGVSCIVIIILQLLFWGNRESFFGKDNSPMTMGEFGLMQLVVLVFSIILGIVVYLLIQSAGFSFETFFMQLEGFETVSY